MRSFLRAVRGVRLLDEIGADLRYGARWLLRSPGFTATAVLSLGLGIGANAAIFNILNAVLLKSLPVHQSQELVALETTSERGTGDTFPYRVFRQFQAESRTLSEIIASAPLRVSVDADGRLLPTASGQLVSGNYHAALGVNAAIGRTLLPSDDEPGAEQAAVLGFGYWMRQFGGRADVLGTTVRLNGRLFTIVGVTAPGFFGTHVGEVVDVSVALATQPIVSGDNEGRSLLAGSGAGDFWLELIGRLRPDSNAARAKAELDARFQQQLPYALSEAGEKGKFMATMHVEVRPGGRGVSELRRRFSSPLVVLMAVVALVLLIACANVVNLLLARAVARRREMAIRVSLGAGRFRLIRQLLTESLLLALAGGAVGGLLLVWSSRPIVSLIGGDVDVSPDLGVVAFTVGLSLLTGIVFGVAPAWWASQAKVAPAPKGLRYTSPRGVLVAAQVALSLVLLVGAALFVRTLANLRHLDLGFEQERVLVVRVEPRGSNQKRQHEAELRRVYGELLEHVRAIPGVRAASFTGTTPLTSENQFGGEMAIDGYTPQPGEDMQVRWMQVYPDYFETMQIPLLAGRTLTVADDSSGAPPVAVINEAMARRFFGAPSRAIGRRFGSRANRTSFAIVGVVGDTRDRALREGAAPLAYATYMQASTNRGQVTLVVRTAGDPRVIVPTVSQLVRQVDPSMPVLDVRTLRERVTAATRQEQIIAWLSGLFGALALTLASIGLYGVVAFNVLRRRAEFGVRLALGASPRRLARLVLGETFTLVGGGIVAGIALAAAAVRMVSHLLFGVAPMDAVSFAGAVAVLLAVGLAAAYVPAFQASRVDPAIALRHE